jgi:hypothetical protein
MKGEVRENITGDGRPPISGVYVPPWGPGSVGIVGGQPGPVGPTGPTGRTGAQGVAGGKGDPGPAGPQGPVGPQGGVGPKGDRGEPGAPSLAPGPAGAQGPTGAKGDRGESGAPSIVTGPTGATGARGPQGERGEPGAPSTTVGPTGPVGASGPQGARGDQGAIGPASTVAGPTGPAGSSGPRGDQGVAGPQGQPGPVGPQGAPGPAGSGSGAIDGSLFAPASHRHPLSEVTGLADALDRKADAANPVPDGTLMVAPRVVALPPDGGVVWGNDLGLLRTEDPDYGVRLYVIDAATTAGDDPNFVVLRNDLQDLAGSIEPGPTGPAGPAGLQGATGPAGPPMPAGQTVLDLPVWWDGTWVPASLMDLLFSIDPEALDLMVQHLFNSSATLQQLLELIAGGRAVVESSTAPKPASRLGGEE